MSSFCIALFFIFPHFFWSAPFPLSDYLEICWLKSNFSLKLFPIFVQNCRVAQLLPSELGYGLLNSVILPGRCFSFFKAGLKEEILDKSAKNAPAGQTRVWQEHDLKGSFKYTMNYLAQVTLNPWAGCITPGLAKGEKS